MQNMLFTNEKFQYSYLAQGINASLIIRSGFIVELIDIANNAHRSTQKSDL